MTLSAQERFLKLLPFLKFRCSDTTRKAGYYLAALAVGYLLAPTSENLTVAEIKISDRAVLRLVVLALLVRQILAIVLDVVELLASRVGLTEQSAARPEVDRQMEFLSAHRRIKWLAVPIVVVFVLIDVFGPVALGIVAVWRG